MQIFLEVGKNIFGMFKVVKTNHTTSEIFAFHFGIKFDILNMCLEHLEISSALAKSLTPVEIRPGVAVATVTGNLVVRDNTFTLHMLEDEEEGEITRVKRDPNDKGEPDTKVNFYLDPEVDTKTYSLQNFRGRKETKEVPPKTPTQRPSSP